MNDPSVVGNNNTISNSYPQQPTAWISTASSNMIQTSQQQQPPGATNVHAPTPTSDRTPMSIYERVRHFLYINLLLNKYSFILSILSYSAQLILFVALNLYLFSNVSYLYELTCVKLPSNGTQQLSNVTVSSSSTISRSIKQSYLTLQIVALFVFFICFILAALIRLQFKYHRLALNLYDYDLEQGII